MVGQETMTAVQFDASRNRSNVRRSLMLSFTRILTADRLRRLVAAGCAGLILSLGILAASPAAHGALHAEGDCHHHAGSDHACAVVLFASGVELPAAAPRVAPPIAPTAIATRLAATEVFLVPPRYLRQPERGPPSHRVS